MSGRFTVESPHDLSLREDGESLIEPEVFKVAVGHQVPRPGVGDLVSDHVGIGLVTTERGIKIKQGIESIFKILS